MRILTKMLKQTAIYWAPLGTDKYGGPEWAAPIELAVRWEEVMEDILIRTGETVQSTATVYVGQDVEVKGMLKLGDLTSSTQANPRNEVGTHEIIKFNKLPTLKATKFLRTAYLS
jgi:hypothetical protein